MGDLLGEHTMDRGGARWMETALATLGPAQRDAVSAQEPVVCVLAGAGTGKTRVLTLRVARRALDGSADPSHVLVCTFSRKAADELGDRLWALGVGTELHAGTFHGTALRLIRQHRADRRWEPPVLLSDRLSLVATMVNEPAPTPESAPRSSRRSRGPRRARASSAAARVEAEIGWAKARMIAPDAYEAAAKRAGRRAGVGAARVSDAYARYEEERQRRGLLDFDDLLLHCADVLHGDRPFAEAVRWRFRHVFVDEMQDLNEAQFRLLELLVGDEPDLFVVGDPDQSVYGWNGADPGLLDRVPITFPGARVVHLDANHRCSPQIVGAAAAALGRSAESAPSSTRTDGPLPRVETLATDAEEAAWVARQVWLAHHPGRRWSSIAVLARTNAQLERLALALDGARVPARVAGPDLGPGSDVRAALRQAATATATRAGTLPGFAAPSGMADDEDDDDTPTRAPGDGVPDDDASDEMDDLGAVERHNPGWGEDAVVLSTFHRAKGLQWPTVFVVGLSNGLVPIAAARTRAARDEERRLLYVALTRAEDDLTCSWATFPDEATAASGAAPRKPSPWLAPIQEALAAGADSTSADPDDLRDRFAALRRMVEL